MNFPGIPLTIGLVLALEAGLKEPALDLAIERSVRLLSFYIGKGAIPYGDHHPWTQTHDDNGKCGMVAVLFNLLGERRGVDFFSRMSLASHGAERDTGTLETSLTRARKLETKMRVNKAAHEGGWRLRFHLRRSWNFPLRDFLDDSSVFFKGDPMLCRSKARTFALRLSVALNLAATRSGSFIRCDSQLSKIVPQNRPKCGCSVLIVGLPLDTRLASL